MSAIEPLRINKGSSAGSPTKSNPALSPSRPLTEINPSERRRNSPSFDQTTKKSYLDSSPLDTSPFASKFNLSPFSSNSPLSYWQSRDPGSPTHQNHENRDPKENSPSPARRPSVENLKKASRVKNSAIFAKEQKLEYDPASTTVLDRPLAAGRPFNSVIPTGLWGKRSDALKSAPTSPVKDMPSFVAQDARDTRSPQHHQVSPTKSSLSRNTRYGSTFEDSNAFSEDEDILGRQLPPGKSLHRHAKSVTFDTAPPEINEYEMTTPDPSSVASGSRQGSYESNEEDDIDGSFTYRPTEDNDDSFDASLEDTEKTPVVLPEDWRFMSPETGNHELASNFEDPFDMRKSPAVGAEPVVNESRPSPSRTDSLGSNGERRPLPPLPSPPFLQHTEQRSSSPGSIQAIAERVASAARTLPNTPKAPSISKADILGSNSASMSLEDRLRLMMLQQDDDKAGSLPRSASDEQRERRLRRAGNSPDRIQAPKNGFTIHEDEPEQADSVLDIPFPSMISRESILRKVKDQTRNDEFHSSPDHSPIPERHSALPIHPDVPIPSLEDTIAEDSVHIKEEEDDSMIDMNSIPELNNSVSHFEQSLAQAESNKNDDSGSHYSTEYSESTITQQAANEDQAPPTPRASAQNHHLEERNSSAIALPQFSSMLGDTDFGSSFSAYTATAYKPAVDVSYSRSVEMKTTTTIDVAEVPMVSPEPDLASESDRGSTPDSVIHHPVVYSESEEDDFQPAPIPESKASVKAPGGLKTRASLAPADVATMAETRRKVSGNNTIPPVPERHRNRPSVVPEGDSFMVEDDAQPGDGSRTKPTKRKSSLLPLEVPVDMDVSLSMGMDKEFDRVMEGAKKGYLMRQNTKLVVASSDARDPAKDAAMMPPPASRGSRSAGNSPVKSSATWTTEPWNGKVRRKSIRQSGGGPTFNGAVPPMPGMSSNVHDIDHPQDETMIESDAFEEGQERGRLFVKVVGVKDLDMPLPRGERSYFCLTLDNGLHCVTTAWLELGRNAPIGQEFELVVLNDLEFQLTLSTKLEEPKPLHTSASPTKLQKPKSSAISRLLASPRKRREQEMRQQEADNMARQNAADAARPKSPSAWDLLHNLVGKDGSFARAFICLKDHETQAYGRPYTVDIPCFNEWTQEEVRHLGSAKSGRSIVGGMQRKAPYKVAKLELQLLYVPKPKDATDEDMPKSMNACIREIAEAEKAADQVYEGHLSQQGGDCPFWRRRFFRLEGSKLTAYHEATRQPRATINLAKATRLIDDKSSLTQKEVSGKGGARRRSAFAQEEEGYMFVEEGFRIRFANGEVIDFYADKTSDKDGWMKVLTEVVGKDAAKSKSWTAVVLKRERALSTRAAKAGSAQSSPTKSAQSTATSFSRPFSYQAQPQRPSSSLDKPLPTGPSPKKMTPAERREKSRTMLF